MTNNRLSNLATISIESKFEIKIVKVIDEFSSRSARRGDFVYYKNTKKHLYFKS